MCWCDPKKKMPYCNVGPCNGTDITCFQGVIFEMEPDLAGSKLLQKITEGYAQDYKSWESTQTMIKHMRLIGEAATKYNNAMIFKHLEARLKNQGL